MNVIKIKKGLDINLKGKAKPEIVSLPLGLSYGVRPDEIKEIKPKLLKKKGERVKAGTILLYDKNNENARIAAPVSGEITEIRRGERRKLLEVVIKPDEQIEYENFDIDDYKKLTPDEIASILINSGLWISFIQRPYGIVADPQKKPKAIHISTFDTAPLAPDYQFIFKDEIETFALGLNIIKKLVGETPIYLNLNADIKDNIFERIEIQGVIKQYFKGKHPTGNVGIQIANTTPIAKGDIIWTIKPQNIIFIARLFRDKKLDLRKIIALAGSEVKEPKYYSIISGMRVQDIIDGKIKGDNVRFISGNPLTGFKVTEQEHIGFYHNLISVIPEGNKYELFGWLLPGFNKFSISRSFFSWLQPKREWVIDTNLHGGKRPFIFTDVLEKVLPMDILPAHFFKALAIEDVELMEKLGIYEVIEEDVALCEFVCVSKIDLQELVSKGISLMIKEFGR